MRVDDTEHVPTEDWVNHFRGIMVKLLPNSPFTAEVNDFIASKDNWIMFNELSYRIKGYEILKAISKLKVRKLYGDDMILNEMLKMAKIYYSWPLKKIYLT